MCSLHVDQFTQGITTVSKMSHYQLTVLVTVCSASLKVLLREANGCFETILA